MANDFVPNLYNEPNNSYRGFSDYKKSSNILGKEQVFNEIVILF